MNDTTKMLTKPKFKRQQFLISFIKELEEPLFSMDLHKLMFLHLSHNHLKHYDFVPYLFGGFSIQLATDIKTLMRLGWVKESNGLIQYSGAKELDFCKHSFGGTGVPIKAQLPNKRGKELVKFVYKKYPYYAINSTIAESLLTREDFATIQLERDILKQQANQVLFTIGYEGRSIEEYLNSLILNNISVLCDVRYNPISRKLGFSKTNLKKYLKSIGIEYVHIPELGIVSNKRTNLDNLKNYQDLFTEYRETLKYQHKALYQIFSILQDKNRIALTCFESDPKMCHRHVVRDYLKVTYNLNTQDL